jgi:hypothetical protein
LQLRPALWSICCFTFLSCSCSWFLPFIWLKFCIHVTSQMQATFPPQLLCNLTGWVIYGEEYKLWIFLLRKFCTVFCQFHLPDIIFSLIVCVYIYVYSRTPLIQVNCDGKSSGYAENLDNWIFLWKWATLTVWNGKKYSTNGCFRLHVYLCTYKTLVHNSLYVFDNWGEKCKPYERCSTITVGKCLS